MIADRGYDHDKYRRLVWQRGVKPIIARRQSEHGSGLGRHRWVVERTFAWFGRNRRLAKDFEATISSSEAWIAVASVKLLSRRLARA